MWHRRYIVASVVNVALFAALSAAPLCAGYKAHRNERDLEAFLSVNPASRGGRLDNCALCHPSGHVTGKLDQKRLVDGCTYCHEVYGLRPPHGPVPLNGYGRDFMRAGRDASAVRTILTIDSDGDGVSNWKETMHRSFPGDAKDHPGLEWARARYVDRAALEAMPKTSVTLLVNTHKSGDFYATYGGVAFADLMQAARVSKTAERVTFFCPDGYTLTVPLRATSGFRRLGTVPQSTFHADLPWVEYSDELNLRPGQTLPGDLLAILAYERAGKPLATAELQKKDEVRWVISAEGPYRLILPQSVPSAPDQPSNKQYPGQPHPFDESLEHNGGACVRCVVALRFEPMPEGTTDVDWSLEGWTLVEQGKIVVYGALDTE